MEKVGTLLLEWKDMYGFAACCVGIRVGWVWYLWTSGRVGSSSSWVGGTEGSGGEWEVIHGTKPGQLEHCILRSSAGLENRGLELLALSCLLTMPKIRPPWRGQSWGMFIDQALLYSGNCWVKPYLKLNSPWTLKWTEPIKSLYFSSRSAWVLFSISCGQKSPIIDTMKMLRCSVNVWWGGRRKEKLDDL